MPNIFSRYDRREDEGAINLLEKNNAYLNEAHTRYIRPIVFNRYNKPPDLYDRHSYQKGAVALHMLRFIIGDKPFFRTLNYFLHKYSYDVVDTHDFMKAIKEVTGQNLDWFFEQWFFKPGHPVFDISYSWNEDIEKLKLRIIQTQDTSKGIPVYKAPVRIAIVTPEGKMSKKVWIREKKEEFEFHVKQKPLMVRFDEGNFLLKEWTFDKSLDELLYQLKKDDVIGVMQCKIKNFSNFCRNIMIAAFGFPDDAVFKSLSGNKEIRWGDHKRKVVAKYFNARPGEDECEFGERLIQGHYQEW